MKKAAITLLTLAALAFTAQEAAAAMCFWNPVTGWGCIGDTDDDDNSK